MLTLVTGGSGLLGHCLVRRLLERGDRVRVLDLVAPRETAGGVEYRRGDLRDAALVREACAGVDVVYHLAALQRMKAHELKLSESGIFDANVAATRNVLDGALASGTRKVVHVSSSGVYGVPRTVPVTEDHPQRPINPYGATKLMVERILQDAGRAHGLRSVILRYFNAAGADPLGAIGEWHAPETHLIPLALEVAAGYRDVVEIYGTDYPTADGTCVRDYIHVVDLARAHVLGLRYLESGRPSAVFNLGNGNGFSVRRVIDTVQKVTGRPVSSKIAPRRAGDPPVLVGSAEKARQALGWTPRFDSLEAIVETAWNWHSTRRSSR